MKFVQYLIIVLGSLVAFQFSFAAHANASALTDYEYQYGQYRQNYAEFSVLKKDYLSNPTLDNQQKSILSAKRSIAARDRAKAAYARYFMALIQSKDTSYVALNPFLSLLDSAAIFFDNQASLGEKLVTADDLKKFSDEYVKIIGPHERSLRYAQVAYKVAQLVRLQIDTKILYDDLVRKLPTPMHSALKSRVDQIPTMSNSISTSLESIVNNIRPIEGEEGDITENYFSTRSELLESVKQQQTRLVDQLIDIDLNYVQVQN